MSEVPVCVSHERGTHVQVQGAAAEREGALKLQIERLHAIAQRSGVA
jgi:hypothetical protein